MAIPTLTPPRPIIRNDLRKVDNKDKSEQGSTTHHNTPLIQNANDIHTEMPSLALRPHPHFKSKKKNEHHSKEMTRIYRQVLNFQQHKVAPQIIQEFNHWITTQPRPQTEPFKPKPGALIPLEMMKLFLIYLMRNGINIDNPRITPYPKHVHETHGPKL
jgi:hypothetical protein